MNHPRRKLSHQHMKIIIHQLKNNILWKSKPSIFSFSNDFFFVFSVIHLLVQHQIPNIFIQHKNIRRNLIIQHHLNIKNMIRYHHIIRIMKKTLNDQLLRQTQPHSKSPKRTIVYNKKKKKMKILNKQLKIRNLNQFQKLNFLDRKKLNQKANLLKQYINKQKIIKNLRKLNEKKNHQVNHQLINKDVAIHLRQILVVASNNERNIQIKTEDTKYQSNKIQ